MNSELKFYSIKEVAKKLNLDPQTVRKLIAEEQLKAFDFSTGDGAKPYYKVSSTSLQKFLEERVV
tara:strand:+ start:2273 stop:2467 length:195 start_codon:yes stop_codon:yes gene_type:complete